MTDENKQAEPKVPNLVIALILFGVAAAFALIPFISWSGLKVPV